MTENRPKGNPLVSIRCLVYNHEPFLRQCLDGFVMQQTTFPFEAIVHDDASTDGSAAIIREYAEKYPDIIKPIFEIENQYSKHDGSLSRIIDAAMHPESKYIARCEGDDYWTDPHKLQIQVDFLESHQDFFSSSHNFSVFHEDTKSMENGRDRFEGLSYDIYNGSLYHTFTNSDYYDIWFLQTLTTISRRECYIDESIKEKYPYYFDYIDFYYLSKRGKCAFFKNNMAVYRMHKGGVCIGSNILGWNEKFLKSNYVLYKLENEERLIPLLNKSFVALFLELIKQKDFKRALYAFKVHHKNVSLKNTAITIKLIINNTFEIICKNVFSH